MGARRATMDAGGGVVDDDLPGYFDEPDPGPETERAGALLAPPRPRTPTHGLIPVGVATQPPTASTVVVQVVPLWPDVASARLGAWAVTAAGRRRPWFVGRDRLLVRSERVRPAGARSCCPWHIRVDVRGYGRPGLPIDVGCAAWSSTRAELHVAPVRAVRDRRRYYRAAHAVLDRLVRDLR
jgi:hypothetical protein